MKPAEAFVVEVEDRRPAAPPLRMPAKPSIRELPQLELECMQVLWDRGHATVGEIQRELQARGRKLAYTTVLTVMERLTRKHVVSREKVKRAFVYAAELAREEMRTRALQNLLRNFFSGSVEELRRHLGVSHVPASQPKAASASDFDASLL
jgi:predicted transcriptional regulator